MAAQGVIPEEFSLAHERLDVYQASLEFSDLTFLIAGSLGWEHRSAKDQLIRASQSIPLNIVEGNGRRSEGDRKRFFAIARDSAFESAAILDNLSRRHALTNDHLVEGKRLLWRIASMLSKMTNPRSPT